MTLRHPGRLALLTAMSVAVLASACSSGTTTVAPGIAVLGAPYATWVRGHPPISVGGQSGYGKAVTINGQSVPEFTDVKQLDGKVVSWHMTLPAGTRLATAEGLVRTQLPTDARQIASWRGSFPGGDGSAYCEFVNYQRVMLARLLGTAPPPPTAANSGTSFYERTATGPGSPSIAKVNSVDVSTAAAVLGQPC